MGWRLTERSGAQVHRRTFQDADEALDALEARGRELAGAAPGDALDARIRRFEPHERVTARLELAGPERLVPSVRAGLDVHGDGSVCAYRGGLRRVALKPRGGESAYGALRGLMAQR